MRLHPLLGTALLAVPFIAVPAAVLAQQTAPGADEFRNSCAVCHGEDGRGDGPLAKVLTVKPADLTQIAKRNDGVFPVEKVSETIDGRQQVARTARARCRCGAAATSWRSAANMDPMAARRWSRRAFTCWCGICNRFR
jgi:Cytochrome c